MSTCLMSAPAPATPKRAARKRRRPASGFGDMPTGPRRVAIYRRRSTDDEHQPFSHAAQDTALVRYITTQPGWTLVAKYADDASGATTDRPGLQQALCAARAGKFDVLLVYRVDRFSRRLGDLLDLLSDLDDAGVAFASATEPFDTSTSIGRMLVQLLGVFAEFERETIIDRVTKGMATKAAKGKWPGGTRPYGYLVDRDTHRLVPHPQEAPHLREIFRLYTEKRLGTRAVADELNRRGVPSRTGAPWSGYTISRIIANPAYAGHIAYGDVYVEDAHEPLIDRETWRKACAIAAARAEDHSQRSCSPGDYHLTGLITCPACGHKYVGTAATGRNRTTATTPASPAPATAPTAAKLTASQPTHSTPPSSTHSRSSTPAPPWPASSPTRSPAPRNATVTATLTAKPNTPRSSPRSIRRKQPSTATSPPSRTTPWMKKPPGNGSPNSAARSHSSPPAPANSPTPSAPSPPPPALA
jgi:DNA invertase Pin-like site-specific DNA recombinase